MKKILLWGLYALAATALLLWLFPHYTLVGIVCLAAGWFGRTVYVKWVAR